MWATLLLFILFLLAWLLHTERTAIHRAGQRLPQLPGTLPLAGYGIWFLRPRYILLQWFAQIQPKMGFDTFEVRVPSLPPAVLVNSPVCLEQILKDTSTFVKGNFFRSRSWDLFEDGILNTDGELWRIQRKAGLRFLSHANLQHFIDDVLPPLLEDFRGILDSAVCKGEVVDLQAELLELTTRFMGIVAFDMDLTSNLPFSRHFDYASGAIGRRFTNPVWRVSEFLVGFKLRAALTEIRAFGATIVSHATKKTQGLALGGGETEQSSSAMEAPATGIRTTLVDSLLKHIKSPSTTAAAATNYLSAGRDTTAQSITWAMYSLLRNPDEMNRLLDTLGSACPQRLLETRWHVSSEDIDNDVILSYLQAVFSESLRLFPAIPFEIKETTCETTLPDGTFLPIGAVVIWVPYAMGRNPEIWGEDALLFRPGRWLEEAASEIPSRVGRRWRLIPAFKSAFENPVFNAGPRMCIGKRLAEMLAVAVIGSLVWEYSFIEVHGQGEIRGERVGQDSLTMPMLGGLPVRVKRRLL